MPIPLVVELAPALDWRVLTFSFVITLVSGLAFGLIPALQASRSDLAGVLKEGQRGGESGGRSLLRNALVVAQVAVCLVLLTGAALLVRSVGAAVDIDLGYEPTRLAVFSGDPRMNGYDNEEARLFFERARRGLLALPGVEAVTVAYRGPLSISRNGNTIHVEGHQTDADDSGYIVDTMTVSHDYFETLEVPIIDGRDLNELDTADTTPVTVISEAMARRYWPGESALGKRIYPGTLDATPIEIVGVSRDYKVYSVGEDPRPFFHLPQSQTGGVDVTVIVRTRGPAAAQMESLRAELLQLEPGLVFIEESTVEQLMGVSLFPVRATALLLASSGLLALVLAAVGLYGVIAFSVSQRTREIGIRMALGAASTDVRRLVVGQGMLLAAIGVVVGFGLSVALGGTLSQILYGISNVDPIAFGASAAVLLAVAAVANYLPARRATRIDPTQAIRRG